MDCQTTSTGKRHWHKGNLELSQLEISIYYKFLGGIVRIFNDVSTNIITFQVVNKWSQIPKMRPLIVQKYVARPHLINNTKYDLRIYVLLTSLCPLRVFLYDEGKR